MDSKIIAVDFDGCLVTNEFPDIGEPIYETINALKTEQIAGARVILWTCRCDEPLEAAVNWCAEQGINLAAVNKNLPDVIEAFGGDTIKVYANEYWDDQAVRMPQSFAPVLGDYGDFIIWKGDERVKYSISVTDAGIVFPPTALSWRFDEEALQTFGDGGVITLNEIRNQIWEKYPGRPIIEVMAELPEYGVIYKVGNNPNDDKWKKHGTTLGYA